MQEKAPLEIERKFLIEYPDMAALCAMPGAVCAQIVQTYLLAPDGDEIRVRARTQDGCTRYVKTLKRRIDDVKRIEIEEEIPPQTYLALLKQADSARRPIEKTRCCLPFAGHLIEIDVYPFWNDRAIAEVELHDEHETVLLPDCIRVIREVTGDIAYTNAALARI